MLFKLALYLNIIQNGFEIYHVNNGEIYKTIYKAGTKDGNPENDRPVNEDDFGDHNVDFFDEYSDEHGNLDDSVEEITTDPWQAQKDGRQTENSERPE